MADVCLFLLQLHRRQSTAHVWYATFKLQRMLENSGVQLRPQVRHVSSADNEMAGLT